jgi:DUF1680 family protein
MPSWLRGKPVATVNGAEERARDDGAGFLTLRRTWSHDRIRLILPKGLTASPLPDRPDTVAFLDGPVLLAALTDHGGTLTGNPKSPESILVPDNEREWRNWLTGYRTVNQAENLRFVPLNSITDQAYTVYFQVRG